MFDKQKSLSWNEMILGMTSLISYDSSVTAVILARK